MPNVRKPNPLIGESIPETLPPNQAADELLMRKGEKVDRACRVYKGTLNVDRIPVGSTDYRDYQAWGTQEAEDLLP